MESINQSINQSIDLVIIHSVTSEAEATSHNIKGLHHGGRWTFYSKLRDPEVQMFSQL